MFMRKRADRIDKISIRPGVSVLSVLRHLNYKPWFALAEFVDNAVQSYLANRPALEAIHGNQFALEVYINIEIGDPSRISIRDNAAGIAGKDFPRAFRPAAVPPVSSGLSEFGMGMKSAACWFAPRWQVRTKAIGEGVERTVRFDVHKIVLDQLEELAISEHEVPPHLHYTEVVLLDMHHKPFGRTITKIKEHLSDIYRVFMREGSLRLFLNGELLAFEEPTILHAPYVHDVGGPARTWRKEILLDFGNGLSARGFAALRDPGNHARSGFALFRRGRLIQGSGDEGYRPSALFKQPGSYRYLRLYGELHLDGFEVSHTKDGFRWDENEQPFLDLLREELSRSELPLLRQADDYRALAARAERQAIAELAIHRASKALEEGLPVVVDVVAANPSKVKTDTTTLPEQPLLASRQIDLDFRGERWSIKVALSDDPGEGQWLAMSDVAAEGKGKNVLEIRLSLAHPFMVRFAQTDAENLEALVRVACAIALAEALARRAGIRYAGTVRRNLNDLLREALSKSHSD
ncbi:MAG TPA: ATP-binding protein [Hyphomicrobium sp.]|nr:ATP-binding protein [Hyphomicrobium sp.]